MADIGKINKINQVISDFFEAHPGIDKIPAKELMPDFIRAGIFTQDERDGLPIRKLLRELDREKRLNVIPSIQPERKTKNTFWYFIRINRK